MLRFFEKFFHSRDKPQNALSGTLQYYFGRSAAGQTVNQRTAMQVTAVYACVRILAESIAGLPLHVYRYKDKGKEMVTDHPLYPLLHDRVKWLYPLMPDRMDVRRDDAGQLVYIYTRYLDEFGGKQRYEEVKLRPDQVLHIPGLGYDGLIGYSPIAMAKNAIGMTMAAEEFGSSFFANGATPSGLLEHPGVVKDPEKVRQSWHAQFSGKNSHNVAVLEEGMTYKPMSVPPNDAQFLETRKFQIDEIARIFRVPPHMVGDLDKSSFSNIEQQSLEFVKYTLNPWVIRLEQAMHKALLLPSEKQNYFIKFNVDGLLRGDYQSRMNGYAVGRQNGWLSANDIREMENLNPISEEEGGNLYLINGNMTKLKDAGLFANKQQVTQNGGNNN